MRMASELPAAAPVGDLLKGASRFWISHVGHGSPYHLPRSYAERAKCLRTWQGFFYIARPTLALSAPWLGRTRGQPEFQGARPAARPQKRLLSRAKAPRPVCL